MKKQLLMLCVFVSCALQINAQGPFDIYWNESETCEKIVLLEEHDFEELLKFLARNNHHDVNVVDDLVELIYTNYVPLQIYIKDQHTGPVFILDKSDENNSVFLTLAQTKELLHLKEDRLREIVNLGKELLIPVLIDVYTDGSPSFSEWFELTKYAFLFGGVVVSTVAICRAKVKASQVKILQLMESISPHYAMLFIDKNKVQNFKDACAERALVLYENN